MTTQSMAAVRLRPLGPEDVVEAHALLSNWEVVRYMLLPLCSQEESEKFVRDAAVECVSPGWRSIVRAILDAPSGRLVGLCGIAILRGSEEGEVWYLVDPQHWGKGLATAAVARLLQLGFAGLVLHRMRACCLPENPASARVLEKNGMRREGFHKKDLKIHGEWKDSVHYAILDEEWQAGGGTA